MIKRLTNINRILNLFLVFIVIYALLNFVSIESKIREYDTEISYYNTQKDELNKKKDILLEEQKNVNSEEYIEKIAREQLDMYLPNETVYVEIGK